MLQATVQKVAGELSEALKAEQKNTVGEMNALQMQVEQCCDELKRTNDNLEKLCKNKNDLHFLQVRQVQNSSELLAFRDYMNTCAVIL